jgi:methionyl-tRNA formyltransferase
MRIIFMGTPGFAVPSLERLAAQGYDIAAVYTQPDRLAGRGQQAANSPVKAAALRLGLLVRQPPSLKEAAVQAELAAARPDIIIVAAYGQILPRAVLEAPPLGCLNLHASLLPRYRGAAPVAAAILAGDAFTGVTVMRMAEKLDAGPILARAPVAIAPHDTTGTLLSKLAGNAAAFLLEILPRWARGEIVPRPQQESEATYFAPLDKAAGRVDWKLPAAVIERGVRAYQPWPGSFTFWRDRQIKILEAVVLPGPPADVPGRVTAPLPGVAPQAAFAVATGEGWLGIRRLQLEGRRALTGAEFLAGQRDFTGACLE